MAHIDDILTLQKKIDAVSFLANCGSPIVNTQQVATNAKTGWETANIWLHTFSKEEKPVVTKVSGEDTINLFFSKNMNFWKINMKNVKLKQKEFEKEKEELEDKARKANEIY